MIITRHKVHHTSSNSMFIDQRTTPNAITQRCKEIPFGVDTEIKDRSYEIDMSVNKIDFKAKKRNPK